MEEASAKVEIDLGKLEAPTKTRKIPVFVAIYPDQRGKTPEYMDALGEEFLLLHPSYNFENDEGAKVLQSLNGTDPAPFPTSGPIYKQIIKRDFWALGKSNCLVYDLDNDPGLHFLGVAVVLYKPIIFVSEVLAAAPAYFSGYAEATVRPENLVLAIKALKVNQCG